MLLVYYRYEREYILITRFVLAESNKCNGFDCYQC